MSTIPGLFVLGEANFSDHGANRLGASALMQGLADGYFVAPYTVANYLADAGANCPDPNGAEFQETKEAVNASVDKLLSIKGSKTARSFHIELGNIMWNECGMARSKEGLTKALELIPKLREEFWNDVRVPGEGADLNVELERAGRVADFLEFGELMCRDALDREESCGGHFRVEHQYEDGEAKRDDENYCHVSVWEYQGEDKAPAKHKEELIYDNVKPSIRSYK